MPGMPNHWQQFFTCIGVHFGLPLLPFLWEQVSDGRVSPGTLTVGGAVYAIAIGASSRNMFLFAITLICALIYMLLDALYTAKNPFALAYGNKAVWWSLGAIVLIHVGERYNRHVMERRPYWEFAENTEVNP